MRIVPRWRSIAKWAVIYAALIALSGWMFSYADDAEDTKAALTNAQNSQALLAEDVRTQKSVAEQLEAQIRALGETPDVTSPALPSLAEGIQGERGPGPTSSQLQLALQLYCLDRGGCRGPVGPVGSTGPAGADSTVAGPAGQDSTVPGPAGPEGKAGADGKNGRGIVSGPECDGDGNLVTHYDQEPLVESHPAPACMPLLPNPDPTP